MADKTTNYELTKPLGSEKYDIGVFNTNWDKIDLGMQANADEVAKKQNKITGALENILTGNLSENRVVVSGADGRVGESEITTDELNCLDGVTENVQGQISKEIKDRSDADSNLQAQINAKVPNSRKVNGKTLDKDITLTTGDIGAATVEDVSTAQQLANIASGKADTAQTMANTADNKANDALNRINAYPNITVSNEEPSGGNDGDLWFLYD